MKCNLISIQLVLSLLFLTVFACAQTDEVENPEVVKAIRAYRNGNLDSALDILNKELSKIPGDATVLNALAIVYMGKKDNDTALRYFDQAIAARDKYYKAINNKLSLLLSMERVDEAIAFLGEIATKYPDYATAWANKAALEMQTRRFEQALASINKAIELDTSDFDAYFKRGQAYLLMRQYDNAVADFDKALSLRPGFPQALEGKRIVENIRDKLAQGYIRISQILVRDKVRADELLTQLRGGADFASLARENSVDATARSGGSLGLVKKGGLIAALEDAMFSLKPGEISKVVASPLGFHIFMRIE